jgi:hypothetical protein
MDRLLGSDAQASERVGTLSTVDCRQLREPLLDRHRLEPRSGSAVTLARANVQLVGQAGSTSSGEPGT